MKCEWSDLERESCAHCQGSKADPDVEAIDPLEGARVSDKHDEHGQRAFAAQHRGTCLHCGDPIEPGQFILGRLADPDAWSGGFKGYYHEDCD